MHRIVGFCPEFAAAPDGDGVSCGSYSAVATADRGQLARSSAEQVAKVRQIVEGLGLAIATPDESTRSWR
jgi:hypothetical protein